jgi:hypothetical protein
MRNVAWVGPLDHIGQPEHLPFFALKQRYGEMGFAVNAVHLLSFT